jgi:hypothetical protein
MRKRSKYKPKPVILNTMAHVLAGMVTMTTLKDKLVQLQLTNHLALEALRIGKATKNDMDVIINAFNITEALAKQKIGDEYQKEIKEAQDALYDCAKRGIENNYRFVMKGIELKAINFVMELHDAQLEASTVKDIELAIEHVNNCLMSKNARPVIERV